MIMQERLSSATQTPTTTAENVADLKVAALQSEGGMQLRSAKSQTQHQHAFSKLVSRHGVLIPFVKCKQNV